MAVGSSSRSFRPAARLCCIAAAWLAAGAGCSEQMPPEKPVARPVKLFTVGGDSAVRTLEYSGRIEAGQHADLGFEVPGRLVAFPVEEGQRVEAGQALARIDPRDYEAEVDAKRALVNAARAELERTQLLFDEQVKSRQELDRSRRNAEVAAANLRIAEKALEDTVLRAPFAGVVARKLVEDFRNVKAKEPVLILQDASTLEIVVDIPERDWALSARPDPDPAERRRRAARLRPRVVVSSYPGRELPAELKEVATAADPVTRTYAVTFRLQPPEGINVLPGMTAKVVVDVPSERAGAGLVVPARAVVSDERGEAHVWRIDPDPMTASKAPVELGALAGDSVEVLVGLEPGDTIAVSGVHQLREGMPVRPLEQRVGRP